MKGVGSGSKRQRDGHGRMEKKEGEREDGVKEGVEISRGKQEICAYEHSKIQEIDEVGQRVGVSFFFQAEDSIRDLVVAGVQTCALPIYAFLGYLRLSNQRLRSDSSRRRRRLETAAFPGYRLSRFETFQHSNPG